MLISHLSVSVLKETANLSGVYPALCQKAAVINTSTSITLNRIHCLNCFLCFDYVLIIFSQKLVKRILFAKTYVKEILKKKLKPDLFV